MRRTRVYVTGPITNGGVEENVRKACNAASQLIVAGYAPMVPQLTAYMQGPVASATAGFPHNIWTEVDLPFVQVCDVMLRLPGESKGADIEEAHAKWHGIPVFKCMLELFDAVPPLQEKP